MGSEKFQEKSKSFITLPTGEQMSAQTVANHFMDQDKPVADQSKAYEAYKTLLSKLFNLFTTEYGNFKLDGSGWKVPEGILVGLNLVPREKIQETNQALEEHVERMKPDDSPEGLSKPSNSSIISFKQDGTNVLIEIHYTGRYTDSDELRKDVQKQLTSQDNLNTLPVEGSRISFPHAEFSEGWKITRGQDGGITDIIEETNSFQEFHFHPEPNSNQYGKLQASKEIQLRVDESPSARAYNRLLAVCFSKFVSFNEYFENASLTSSSL